MIMEIRDGMIKVYNPFRYIQFLLFFPTISSGPIDRYRRFEKDQLHPPVRDKYVDLLGKGVQNIFVGFYISSLSVIILVKYCSLQ